MGNILIIISIIITSLSLILFLLGIKNKAFEKYAVVFSYSTAFFTILTFVFLAYLYLTHNFSYLNVYRYTNLEMPAGLTFVSVWAGQSGSFLLWAVFNSVALLISLKDKIWRRFSSPIVLSILLMVLILFYTSNPFALTQKTVSDGLGLNPMLSHPLMYIHPPFAFLGYAFLGLIYAYAVSSLIKREYSSWLKKTQKWIMLSILGFTVAIVLGSLWAYETLGWGGYWSFDPIENGTLITWLFIVALFHTSLLYKKYGKGLKLSILLAILSFAGVMHTTFLTRSGLLANISAHSYVESGLLYGLLFLEIIILLIPLILFILRFNDIKEDKKRIKHIFYEEFALFLAPILILILALVLIIGTNYPLFTYLLGEAKNIQLSFYYRYFSIFSIILILGIAFGNICGKHHPLKFNTFLRAFFVYLFISACLSLLLFIIFDLPVTLLNFIVLLIGFLAISTSFKGLKHLSLKNIGGKLTSVAVGILLIGVFFSSTQDSSLKVNLFKERTFFKDSYSFLLKDEFEREKKYLGEVESLKIEMKGNGELFTAKPKFWHYTNSLGQEVSLPMPYIKKTLKKDFYISPALDGEASIKKGEERKIADYTVKVLSIEEEEKGENLIEQTAKLDINFNGKNENLSLNRGVDKKGFILYSNPVHSTLLNEIIELRDFSLNEITITSSTISNSIEMEIIKKPLMSFLRFGYYLIIIGLLLSTIKRFIIKVNNN
ncbi:MAG TPA: cytochrome c biogenesis protein CcsA [Caldisericia bacterium]|nr:cytochrome c biogenesis protein CcsA [Caldisericia bacterium]